MSDVYQQYDELVGKVITETRRMAHCDQWVLHSPGTCTYCDKYPELQQFRIDNKLNFGENEAGLLSCPAEMRRPQEKIERWGGNVATF